MNSLGAAPLLPTAGVLPSSAPLALTQRKPEVSQGPYIPKMKHQRSTFKIPRASTVLATSPTRGIFEERPPPRRRTV